MSEPNSSWKFDGGRWFDADGKEIENDVRAVTLNTGVEVHAREAGGQTVWVDNEGNVVFTPG